MSEDRWTYPAAGDTSRDIDEEVTDAATVAAKQHERAVTHPQVPGRTQGLSSDAPGVNPAERGEEGGQPTFEAAPGEADRPDAEGGQHSAEAGQHSAEAGQHSAEGGHGHEGQDPHAPNEPKRSIPQA